jgi:hypothetical protein
VELAISILGLAIGLLALLGLVWQIRLQVRFQERKTLDYTILANPRLPQIDASLKERVQILLDGIPVTSVHGVVLELRNTGNTPIRAEDFEERQIEVVFGETARVVTKQIQTNREKMAWVAVDLPNGFSLVPMLLNPGDALTITALISEYERAKVEGRLVGVSEIRDVTGVEEKKAIRLGANIAVVFTMIGFALPISSVILAATGLLPRDSPFGVILALMLAGIGCIVIAYGVTEITMRTHDRGRGSGRHTRGT